MDKYISLLCYDLLCYVKLQAGQKIEDLYEDFKDGSKLLLLLELLTDEKLVCECVHVE